MKFYLLPSFSQPINALSVWCCTELIVNLLFFTITQFMLKYFHPNQQGLISSTKVRWAKGTCKYRSLPVCLNWKIKCGPAQPQLVFLINKWSDLQNRPKLQKAIHTTQSCLKLIMHFNMISLDVLYSYMLACKKAKVGLYQNSNQSI